METVNSGDGYGSGYGDGSKGLPMANHLPSERINEIYDHMTKEYEGRGIADITDVMLRIDSIREYLDEQYRKGDTRDGG